MWWKTWRDHRISFNTSCARGHTTFGQSQPPEKKQKNNNNKKTGTERKAKWSWPGKTQNALGCIIIIIMVIIAVISIALYLTDKGEHMMLYQINKMYK